MDFKNKANNNIQGQLPLSKHKRLRDVSNSTIKRPHFKIMVTLILSGFSQGHENNINFLKDNFYNMSFSRVFQSVKTPYYSTQNTRDTKRS